eukprot:Gregarina_sp_Poly_1__6888@NODE_3737_length_905_cov_21_551313_g2397_i0_p1_GENE_NODE_3737_length_905_cov_21_551313_g2397_i0NODE_3737_length_905_cov_21_551313_g2397_i0_p1_ORF_typecomplete_len124_score15_62_NODE_3737_length_905_cov_21_551313_g2397_i0354725
MNLKFVGDESDKDFDRICTACFDDYSRGFELENVKGFRPVFALLDMEEFLYLPKSKKHPGLPVIFAIYQLLFLRRKKCDNPLPENPLFELLKSRPRRAKESLGTAPVELLLDEANGSQSESEC